MATLRQCTRCLSTSLRTAQQQPIPVPRDWENAPIVTRRPHKPADFSHIADPAARRAFEMSSKAYYLILGVDPGACVLAALPRVGSR